LTPRIPAFDVTPARYIAAIFTERGVARAPYTDSLQALASAPQSAFHRPLIARACLPAFAEAAWSRVYHKTKGLGGGRIWFAAQTSLATQTKLQCGRS